MVKGVGMMVDRVRRLDGWSEWDRRGGSDDLCAAVGAGGCHEAGRPSAGRVAFEVRIDVLEETL